MSTLRNTPQRCEPGTVGDAVKLSQRDQKRLSAALRSAGYERKRGRLGGGQLAYRWYPK